MKRLLALVLLAGLLALPPAASAQPTAVVVGPCTLHAYPPFWSRGWAYGYGSVQCSHNYNIQIQVCVQRVYGFLVGGRVHCRLFNLRDRSGVWAPSYGYMPPLSYWRTWDWAYVNGRARTYYSSASRL